jgi:hypothetical protein
MVDPPLRLHRSGHEPMSKDSLHNEYTLSLAVFHFEMSVFHEGG